MSGRRSIEYRDASPEVRAVFDDIKRTRRVDDVNNFWKYLARDPATLTRSLGVCQGRHGTGRARHHLLGHGDRARGQRRQRLRVTASPRRGRRGAQGRHERENVRRADGGRGHGERDQPPRQRLPGADRCGLREVVRLSRARGAHAPHRSAVAASRRSWRPPALERPPCRHAAGSLLCAAGAPPATCSVF